jgi:hypothetical protein
VKFESQLRNSALHIADREILYRLLKKEPEVTPSESNAPPPAAEPIIDTPDLQQTVIDTAKNSEDLINEIEKEDIGRLAGDALARPSLILSAGPENDDDATILIIDGESGSVEERITYMDPGFAISGPEELLELTTDENQEEDQPVPESNISGKRLQAELIDKFIQANPRIEPRREKSDTPPVDISTPSIEENRNFVTETLAKIYVRQGYYSRAIDIYEKLSLKFPEKSSYFATQIEKIKELIKK